jgi:hypothetical protein
MKLVIAASAAIFLLTSASVPAHAGKNAVSGHSGSVKTQDSSDPKKGQNSKITGEFKVSGKKYSASASGTWEIRVKPWKESTVLSGTWTAGSGGQFTTNTLTLPQGHYKLFVYQAGSTQAKHKVFKIIESKPVLTKASPVVSVGSTLTQLPITGPSGITQILSAVMLGLGLLLRRVAELFLKA